MSLVKDRVPLSIVLQCLEVLFQLCVPAGYGSEAENVTLLMLTRQIMVCMRSLDEVRHFLYSSQRPLLVVQGHKTKLRHFSGIMRQDSIGKCVAQFLEILIHQMEETLSPIEFTDSVACTRLMPMMFTYTIFMLNWTKPFPLRMWKHYWVLRSCSPNRFHKHLLKELANWIIVTGIVYHSLIQSSKCGTVWLIFWTCTSTSSRAPARKTAHVFLRCWHSKWPTAEAHGER